MKIKLFLIGMLVTSGLLTGCSSSENEESHIEHVHGDIREETTDAGTLPSFLDNKPENMQVLYTAVGQSKDLLEQIPCYCGCGESVGHKNNYDCFIHENRQDGAVIWDDHATKCKACLEIASKSIVDYQDGKSVQEIRDEIDQTYQQGYAKPTPTPEI